MFCTLFNFQTRSRGIRRKIPFSHIMTGKPFIVTKFGGYGNRQLFLRPTRRVVKDKSSLLDCTRENPPSCRRQTFNGRIS